MATKDITDKDVCEAIHCQQAFNMPVAELLQKVSGQCEKVCEAAVQRAINRGLADCGVSNRWPWLTESGKALRESPPITIAGRKEQVVFDLIAGNDNPDFKYLKTIPVREPVANDFKLPDRTEITVESLNCAGTPESRAVLELQKMNNEYSTVTTYSPAIVAEHYRRIAERERPNERR